MRNPDLVRYWWVEAPPLRLVMALVLVCGMSLAIYLSGPNVLFPGKVASGLAIPFPLMSIYACAVMFGLWGTRVVVASVLDEIQDGLWDLHRLSGLSPWQMVTGRIFGACAMVWVCCGVLAGLFVAHGVLETDMPLGMLLLRAVLMLLIGLCCLAAALMQALMITRLAGRRLGHVLAQMAGLGVMIALGLKLDLINFLLDTNVPRVSVPIEHSGQYWFGGFVDKSTYMLAVCGISAGGLLIAAWRAMYLARGLTMPPVGVPIGAMAMGLAVAVHGAGLEPWRSGVDYRHISWLLWAMSWAILYSIFFSNNNLFDLRGWGLRRGWARKFSLVPGWVAPFLVLVCGTFWLMLWQQTAPAIAMRPAQMYGTAPAWVMLLLGIGFTCRDLLLVVCLSTRRDRRPVAGRILLVFGVCYGMGMMFDAIGILHLAVLFAWPWQPAFNPDIATGISRIHQSVPWVAMWVLWVQLGLMTAYLWFVLRRRG